VADLSRFADVAALANAVAEKYAILDVLINNAGIFKTPNSVTDDRFDVRFAVNKSAPYLLTKRLLPLLGVSGRVKLDDMDAHAQSKLALSRDEGLAHHRDEPSGHCLAAKS
jgi:NAD(P)-dependent dehydrogenase (short-subunit alcohol dehydrogenase family)